MNLYHLLKYHVFCHILTLLSIKSEDCILTRKEEIQNNILIAMKNYLNTETLQILETIIIRELSTVDLVELETLPSTEKNTNEYIMNLFELHKAPNLSKKTVFQYMMSVNRLCDIIHKSLTNMTGMDLEYFLLVESKKGNSNVSVNNIRRNISAFFSWMRKSHLILENPCDSVENRKEIQKPVEFLEGYELEDLRKGCQSVRDRALLEFLRSTGVRIGEVPAIRKQDIDWHTGEILIYANKTCKYRTVILDDIAKYHLKIYIETRSDTCSYLFVSCRHPINPLQADGLRYLIKQIAVRVNMPRRVYPHLLRKTFATTLNNKGCPLPLIQQLMGHAVGTKTTTQHYIATNQAQLLEAHKKYI